MNQIEVIQEKIKQLNLDTRDYTVGIENNRKLVDFIKYLLVMGNSKRKIYQIMSDVDKDRMDYLFRNYIKFKY